MFDDSGSVARQHQRIAKVQIRSVKLASADAGVLGTKFRKKGSECANGFFRDVGAARESVQCQPISGWVGLMICWSGGAAKGEKANDYNNWYGHPKWGIDAFVKDQ